MVSNIRALTRACVVVSASTVVALVSSAPARAEGIGVDGPAPTVMSPAEVVLVFGVIPLSIIGIIWLLVCAPGWTRNGRPDSVDAWTGDPVVVGNQESSHSGLDAAPAAGTATALGAGPGAAADAPGGTSARW
jgi:hypothetical protein